MELQSMLDRFLSKYPNFFTKAETSNHYKWADTVSEILQDLDTQAVKVELGKSPDRPFQLWRVQTTDYNYTMNMAVRLPDIKQVQLWLDGTVPALVADSGILPTGTNIFESEYNDRDVTKVPTKKYYLHITDYYGHEFYKGFPENQDIQDDIYDRDLFLDVIGKINQIPRRKLLTGTSDSNLTHLQILHTVETL